MSLVLVVLCSLLFVGCQADVPDGYLLKVSKNCGSLKDGARIKIASDLHVKAVIKCAGDNDINMKEINDTNTKSKVKVYYPGGGSGTKKNCFFKRPHLQSGVFVVELDVYWGFKEGTLMNDYEAYTITCTTQSHAEDTISGKTISQDAIAVKEGLVGNLGSKFVGVKSLKLCDVLDQEITDKSIPMSKKVKLELSFTPTNISKCEADWLFIHDACYRIFNTTQNWVNAATECKKKGGFLATVDNDDLHKWLEAASSKLGNIWIGLQDIDKDKTFDWEETNKALGVFEEWCSNEPSGEPCVHYNKFASGKKCWNDISCHHKMLYVCQKTAMSPGLTPYNCEAKNSDNSKTYRILNAGCGDGVIFPKDEGFNIVGTTATSPFFKQFMLFESLTNPTKISYSCDFAACKDACDGSSCATTTPVKRRKRAYDRTTDSMSVSSATFNIKPNDQSLVHSKSNRKDLLKSSVVQPRQEVEEHPLRNRVVQPRQEVEENQLRNRVDHPRQDMNNNRLRNPVVNPKPEVKDFSLERSQEYPKPDLNLKNRLRNSEQDLEDLKLESQFRTSTLTMYGIGALAILALILALFTCMTRKSVTSMSSVKSPFK